MNVLYFGSDDFGIPCLEEISSSHTLTGIVTAPDRPRGRGYHLAPTAVKQWALPRNIPVYQPERICREPALPPDMARPDLIVLISYGQRLPSALLSLPRIAAINVHPSLLPRHRGAAPIEWCLIRGDRESGVTVIRMSERIDCGEILARDSLPVYEDDTAFTLKQRLMHLSVPVLRTAICRICAGEPALPQKGTPSCAPRLRKQDGLLHWAGCSAELHNRVRGLSGWPGAYTFLPTAHGRKLLKIWKSAVGKRCGNHGRPGEVLRAGSGTVEVACGTGSLLLLQLQLESRKVLNADEFSRGVPIPPGTCLVSTAAPAEEAAQEQEPTT